MNQCMTTTWECLISFEDLFLKRGDEVFPFFLNLGMVLVVLSLLRNSIACVWWTKRVGVMVIEIERMQIHFLCDVFFHCAVAIMVIQKILIFQRDIGLQRKISKMFIIICLLFIQDVTGLTFLIPYSLDHIVNGQRVVLAAVCIPLGKLCIILGVMSRQCIGQLERGWWNMGVALFLPRSDLLWLILFLAQQISSRFSKLLECTQEL